MPFQQERADYHFNRANRSCFVRLKNKERKKIHSHLKVLAPTTLISPSLIKEFKEKEPVVAWVMHDFFVANNASTVGDILNSIKIS